mmetsp:Transcript_23785/g.59689  ORF Transcript_23785/g.59689 Transcript_23785/m.59689 type:complete len:100 (-) Transcript_23785:99-398(-)
MWQIQAHDAATSTPLKISLYVDGQHLGTSIAEAPDSDQWAGSDQGSWGSYNTVEIGANVPLGEVEMFLGPWTQVADPGVVNLYIDKTVDDLCVSGYTNE